MHVNEHGVNLSYLLFLPVFVYIFEHIICLIPVIYSYLIIYFSFGSVIALTFRYLMSSVRFPSDEDLLS